MKISLNWLKEYVDIPKELELKDLVSSLTMSTVEVEDAVNLKDKFNNIVVGKIVEILPHPDADKLKICKTDIGNNEIKDIVCGGSNVEKNMLVAVALPGAKVRWHGEGELIELSVAKVRGVESYGMICAASEIGLGDLFPSELETGILDLSAFNLKVGENLAVALNLDDTILEIDNKSLTNRPDLWGHYGIAREISAIFDLPLKPITSPELPVESGLEVVIEDNKACPRYIGVKIEGVSPIESAFDLKTKLWSVGIRPINALVDITNYVMLVTGNPTHAFDADMIRGNITVRQAKKDEKLELLDSKELVLRENDLVIADNKGAVALAGIMGGIKDSILPNTSKIIFEIANFEPLGIRRTANHFEVRTESSSRFEKGIDQDRCNLALSVAFEMLKSIYPDLKITGYKDNHPNKAEVKQIEVSLSWLEKRLGKKLPDNEIKTILERLGFKVEIKSDLMEVIVPSWRATGDVSITDDILEEVARIHGFENFEAMPITTTFTGIINQIEVDLERKIKEYLAIRCGMQEIFTYPWVPYNYLKATKTNEKEMLTLVEPPSLEEKYLRSSHIPNLCKAVSDNLRYYDEFAIFESAEVFFNKNFTAKYNKEELLPQSNKSVAGAIVGNPKDSKDLFRTVKGIFEEMASYVHLEAITFDQKEKPAYASDNIWLNIVHNSINVGSICLLDKKVALDCGIKNSAVALFEINLDLLKPLPSRTNTYLPLPEYPITEYDLSLLFDLTTTWQEIIEVINKVKDEVLRNVIYIDEYKGEQIPQNKKSLTLRLEIGSNTKTLTSEEIEACAKKVINTLEKELKASLR